MTSESSQLADLLVAAVARDIAEADIRVFAVTTPASVVAGLAARDLGARQLALAAGFTALDGLPVPAVSLGEAGLLAAGQTFRDEPSDVGPRGGPPPAAATRFARTHQPLGCRSARSPDGCAARRPRAARSSFTVPRLVPPVGT